MMSDSQPKDDHMFSINAIHLVRTTQQINVTLSQMADQKASILMGATFVVFTIGVGQAARQALSVPLLILIAFSFLSALLAVFAIMPSVTPTKNGGNNILFFGVFSRMTESDYTDEVMENLHDDEHIYRTMLRDVYQNGLVLQNKKYKYLGYAYRVFLAGMMLTLIALMFDQFGVL
ncbi:MAG: Pycsar system effector family protein [Pseudomonadota bacterium]